MLFCSVAENVLHKPAVVVSWVFIVVSKGKSRSVLALIASRYEVRLVVKEFVNHREH